MFSRTGFLAVVLLLSTQSFADDFSDFRIPDHRVFSLRSEFNGSFYRSDVDLEASFRNSQRWSGAGSAALYWLLDSDRLRTLIRSSAFVSGSHRTNESADYQGSPTASSDRLRSVSETASASWEGWLYPFKPPFGFYGRFRGSARTGQYWTSHMGAWSAGEGNFLHTRDTESWSYDYQVAFSGGLAYGRVRDVTNVYEVLIAEQRLIDDGVLSSPLLPETRQKLAGLFYDKQYYRYRYERDSKYFWRDIEHALRGDPAFDETKFDNYALYHMIEPTFNRNRYIRSRGWVVSPIINIDHDNRITRSETREFVSRDSVNAFEVDTLNLRWERRVRQDDFVSAGFRLTYNLPINLRWQVDVGSECFFDVEPPEHGFSLTNHLAVDWEIADRWRANFLFQHTRIQQDRYANDYYYR